MKGNGKKMEKTFERIPVLWFFAPLFRPPHQLTEGLEQVYISLKDADYTMTFDGNEIHYRQMYIWTIKMRF